MEARGDFDQKILECIEAGLGTFGKNFKKAVFVQLNGSDGDIHSLLNKPERFILSLERVYGPGAKLMERAMVRELKARFRLSSEGSSLVQILLEVKKLNQVAQKSFATGRTASSL